MKSITVPITHYQEVNVDDEGVEKLLRQEQKSITRPWDCIEEREKGVFVYHNRGYGSHDIGEEDGPVVHDQELLDNYLLLGKAIQYFWNKRIRAGESK